jgi:acyl carrier protein
MTAMTKIEELINSVIHAIQEQHGHAPSQITGKTRLIQDLGFTSLDMAQLIAMMEGHTGIDPFAAGATLDQLSTVDILTKLYDTGPRLEVVHG